MNSIIQRLYIEAGRLLNFSIQIGGSSLSIKMLIQSIFLLIVFVYLCRLFKRFLQNYLLKQIGIDANNREAISTLVSYSSGALLLIILGQEAGINLNSLAVIGGALGVGIGFGLQNIAKDLVSGFAVLFERKIKVGDFVEFDGKLGHVKEIALRSTVIRTRDGGDIVVPNGYLLDRQILNWTSDSLVARIKIPVLLSHGSDILLVTEALLNSAHMEPAIVSDPAPKAMFRGYDSEGMKFELWVWINRIDLDDHIKSSLYFIIEYNLRLLGLEVPRPQRDLWLRNPEALLPLMPSRKAEVFPLSDRDMLVSFPPPLSLGKLLKQVAYFENFSELQLRQLIEIGYRQRLRESEILFHENEAGDAFYIILSGTIEVRIDRLDKHLANLQAGDFFGELALMLGIPRTATVKATEETMLFAIDRLGFKKLLQENPDITKILTIALEERQAELAKHQAELQRLGLIPSSEDEKNPISWVQNRLKTLFGLSMGKAEESLPDRYALLDRSLR
jgi:potassium-dependent mechanosensitive channel